MKEYNSDTLLLLYGGVYMSKAFYSMGILCILYYLLIVLHTHNWKATFARFWVIFGGVQFAIGFGISILIIFIYYGVMTFAGALGKGGALPTVFAALIPDTLGIIAGLYLNWRVSK